jgi:hypothetical protein
VPCQQLRPIGAAELHPTQRGLGPRLGTRRGQKARAARGNLHDAMPSAYHAALGAVSLEDIGRVRNHTLTMPQSVATYATWRINIELPAIARPAKAKGGSRGRSCTVAAAASTSMTVTQLVAHTTAHYVRRACSLSCHSVPAISQCQCASEL